ncbi:MAG: type II toxin-antitoxin system RelE/ParE family toxin [Bacteroidetes bacterium]|nr:type II toxin-antitoxin system RelE/ParE family toxin [Bacteroidota bacterium]MCB0841839.1 type II toxin-antitoxin system RelE/ParE family toxin [Bacteroidota bacterium]MCB0854012.1 type II toxin-antitoxin system RelE/ParE family toxin [Bacteroidota bacterium]
MISLPVVMSEAAAADLETILLILETTQGIEAANSFMNRFLDYLPMTGTNPEFRPKREFNGYIYYRFVHPAWNYIFYYDIIDNQVVIFHIVGL